MFRFFLKLIGSILLADQKPALNNALAPTGSVIAIIVIYFLLKYEIASDLISISFVLSSAPIVVLITASFYFFGTRFKQFSPSWKDVDFDQSKGLLSLGFNFFLTQIAAIVFFSTSNFLIAHFASQEEVAVYNVAYKYLFTINMLFSIILTPFWSAVTDAMAKNDFDWIKKSLQALKKVSFVMVLGLCIAAFIAPWVYELWVGERIQVSKVMTWVVALYLGVQVMVAPYSTLINGFGKLKLSIVVIFIKMLLFIPLAWLLGKEYGAVGVVVCLTLIQLPSLFVESFQVKKLINKNANGIWGK